MENSLYIIGSLCNKCHGILKKMLWEPHKAPPFLSIVWPDPTNYEFWNTCDKSLKMCIFIINSYVIKDLTIKSCLILLGILDFIFYTSRFEFKSKFFKKITFSHKIMNLSIFSMKGQTFLVTFDSHMKWQIFFSPLDQLKKIR